MDQMIPLFVGVPPPGPVRGSVRPIPVGIAQHIPIPIQRNSSSRRPRSDIRWCDYTPGPPSHADSPAANNLWAQPTAALSHSSLDIEGMFLLDEEQSSSSSSEEEGPERTQDATPTTNGLDEFDEFGDLRVGNDIAEQVVRNAGYTIAPRKPRPTRHSSDMPSNQSPSTENNPLFLTNDDVQGEAQSAPREQLLESDALLQFARKGHVALRGLIDRQEVCSLGKAVKAAFDSHLLEAYQHIVKAHVSADAAAEIRTAEDGERILTTTRTTVPFLQLFNLHTHVPEVDRLVKSTWLGQVAAELLGVDSVRLYQDAVFWKRAGDGPTPWHADLKMVPLDTNDFVTFFIPMRSIKFHRYSPGLRYATGSHRDFAAGYWYNVRNNDCLNLSRRYSEDSHETLMLGDVSAHHGWTLHSSPGIPPGSGSRGRMALSVSYVSADACVLPRIEQKLINPEDYASYSRWIKDVRAGKRVRHELLPVVYPQDEEI